MRLEFRVRGAEDVAPKVGGAIASGLRAGLVALANRGVFLVQENILRPKFGPPIVASSDLLESIATELRDGPGMIGSAVVFSEPPAGDYAGYVEAGTGPHFPPPRQLLPWIRKKFNPSGEKQAVSIAYAVAHAIAKRGTLGRGMFHAAFQQLETEAPGIMQVSLAKSAEQAGLRKS